VRLWAFAVQAMAALWAGATSALVVALRLGGYMPPVVGIGCCSALSPQARSLALCS